MSRENVEIVRAAIDAFNRGDFEAALEHAAPGAEIDLSRAVGPVHGVFSVDQWRERLADFADIWENLRIEPDEFIDAGRNVVVPWTMHGRGREGIEVTIRVTWVWTIQDQAIERVAMYQERQEALDAAEADD
jgi:ketosteroid isomerase-like protein